MIGDTKNFDELIKCKISLTPLQAGGQNYFKTLDFGSCRNKVKLPYSNFYEDINFIIQPTMQQRLLFFSPGTSGFTFVEIILALALLSILTAIFGMGLVAAMESFAFSRSNSDLAQKGQIAMQRMGRELSELVDIRKTNNDPVYIIYDRIAADSSGNPSKMTMGLYHDKVNGTVKLYTDLSDGTQLPPAEGTYSENYLMTGVFHDDADDGFSFEYLTDDSDNTYAIKVTLKLDRLEAPTKPQVFTLLVHMRNNGNDGGRAPID